MQVVSPQRCRRSKAFSSSDNIVESADSNESYEVDLPRARRIRQRRRRIARSSSQGYDGHGTDRTGYTSHQSQPCLDTRGQYPMYPSYVQPVSQLPLQTQSSQEYAPHTQSKVGYATYPQHIPYYAGSTNPYMQYMPGYTPYPGMMPNDAHCIPDSSPTRRDQRIMFVNPLGVQRSFAADEKPNSLGRPLKERQVDQANIKRRGTTDWEEQKPSRRVRYTIPLRSNRNVLWDEENALCDTIDHPIERCGRQEQVRTNTSEVKDLNIVSTHCIPNEDGRETISLTVLDQPRPSGQENVPCESRWRYLPSKPRHDQVLIGNIQTFPLQDFDV